MVYGRCTSMRGTPMRWAMGDARLWEMHAYGRCTPMGDARLWEMHAYGRCTPMGDARLWEMHAYGRCTPMGDARLWEMHASREKEVSGGPGGVPREIVKENPCLAIRTSSKG